MLVVVKQPNGLYCLYDNDERIVLKGNRHRNQVIDYLTFGCVFDKSDAASMLMEADNFKYPFKMMIDDLRVERGKDYGDRVAKNMTDAVEDIKAQEIKKPRSLELTEVGGGTFHIKSDFSGAETIGLLTSWLRYLTDKAANEFSESARKIE